MMSLRIRAGLCLLAFVTSLPAQQNPTWWDEVIRSGDDHSIEANYRPANLGQLKNVAEQARLHLDEELASLGGAGEVIQNLIEEWEPVVPSENYAPINLGQLKYVADLFYARLDEVGFDFRPQLIAQGYGGMWTGSPSRPWNEATPAEENYAPANIGQLKALFTFDLSPLADSDYDSMPDWFEQKIIDASLADDDPNNDITTFAQVTLNGDFDGDGLTNGRELELGSDPTDPTSGLNAALLGWWTFNEGYGNVIYDSSPYSRHGTLTASYAWHKVPWERKYIEFTDSTGRAEIPSSDLLLGENNSDFTVAFWMKVNQGPTGNWRVLAHKGNNDAERTFAMWLRPDSMQIHYRISGNHPNGNMGNDSDPTKPVPVGSWTHIAYVKQGSTLRIYINGVSAGSAGLPGPVVANNGPIYIGHNLIHNNSKAAFDDFRIYKVALNAAEIASLQQQEDLDTDHDTLSDAFEALVGTNPTLPDSDWDGIGDAQEVKVDGTDPNNPDSVIHRRIAYFPFDATDWRGNEGQVRRPLGGGQTAATQVTSFWGRALHIGQSGQFHAYDWCRSDGSPNYSFYKGTIRLWIKPDWSAPGMSGTWSRLYEIGALWGTSGKSWQQIRFWASGQATMNFNANDGAGHGYDHETPSSPGFNWAAGTWHEVVMTYSPSGRKFYVDGQQIDSTTKPWPYKPKIEDLIQYGLKFGTEGSQPLKGALDEVEIFNYELSAAEVASAYAPKAVPDANNNGINDNWEQLHYPEGLPGQWDPNGDDDQDGLTNVQEAAFGSDPNNPSSSGTGISDGWAADYGYNPRTITGTEDEDQDGLTLKQEYHSGTDPENPDTDGDNAIDGQDGWALEAGLYPARLPDPQFIYIDLAALTTSNDAEVDFIDDFGGIYWTKYNYSQAYYTFKKYYFNPTTLQSTLFEEGNEYDDLAGWDFNGEGFAWTGFGEECKVWKRGEYFTTYQFPEHLPVANTEYFGATWSINDVGDALVAGIFHDAGYEELDITGAVTYVVSQGGSPQIIGEADYRTRVVVGDEYGRLIYVGPWVPHPGAALTYGIFSIDSSGNQLIAGGKYNTDGSTSNSGYIVRNGAFSEISFLPNSLMRDKRQIGAFGNDGDLAVFRDLSTGFQTSFRVWNPLTRQKVERRISSVNDRGEVVISGDDPAEIVYNGNLVNLNGSSTK